MGTPFAWISGPTTTAHARRDSDADSRADGTARHIDLQVAGWTVVRITSDLELSACDDLDRQLRPRITPGSRIAVDLRHAHLHSRGCPATLRSLQEHARTVHAQVVVVESDPLLRSELLLAGVDDVHPSLDAAVHQGVPALRPPDQDVRRRACATALGASPTTVDGPTPANPTRANPSLANPSLANPSLANPTLSLAAVTRGDARLPLPPATPRRAITS